ncbi:hypothetical protein DRE_02319 [Drechslerella stenobrocha 248]|uniref:DUF5745 domain-containing protein n=1 Tax=Drechslerella stenobrocha 248 TaxID=1043628 RepID=W7IGB0_9PEZI|nr:hypothetical protein DRE_02319 [Drechslerella stenobrocha 248]
MPSLVALSEISAIGDNVIPQLNAILKGTPLPQIRSINDITPSLLLDLYELLFHIKLAYATPRDLSADSQLRNIRVLIGHIAHDILKMDLSFLEPQRICMRDEKALGDFLRIFLGVARLRKAHLDKGGHKRPSDAAGTASSEPDGSDKTSQDGSGNTIKATPGQTPERAINATARGKGEHRIVIRSANPTPQKGAAADRRASFKQALDTDYPPPIYKPLREIDFNKLATLNTVPPKVPTAPASDTSSIPSDFIHNANERVSNIWNKLSVRASKQTPIKTRDRSSSHSPQKAASSSSRDTLPGAGENRLDGPPATQRPQKAETTQPRGYFMAEPTPQLKAWLTTAGIDGTNSSHRPRSTHTTPEKPIPTQSTRTAPAGLRHAFRRSPEESPIKARPATMRSKSSLHNHHQRQTSHSLRGHSSFPLRRVASAPPSHLGMDVSKAMFSNEPIRLSGRADTQSQESDSSEDDDAGDDTDTGSPASSIATSALSVSSVEWSDTASIAELRKIRLEALEEIQQAQEEAALAEEYEREMREAEIAKKHMMYSHGRRRSSIPSTFMHQGRAPRSTVSYETISPHSSASVAAERWKSRWQIEAEALAAAAAVAGSTRNRNSNARARQQQQQQQHQHQQHQHRVVYDEYESEDDDAGKEEGGDVDDNDDDDDDDDALSTQNTEELEQELRGLDEIGLNESKRQILLFERLIRRAVDNRPPGR